MVFIVLKLQLNNIHVQLVFIVLKDKLQHLIIHVQLELIILSQEGTSSNSSCITCGAGGFCPLGSASGTPCPAGTYSNQPGLALIGQCIICQPSYYCFSNSTAPSSGCHPGYYCPAGTQYPSENPHVMKELGVQQLVVNVMFVLNDHSSFVQLEQTQILTTIISIII